MADTSQPQDDASARAMYDAEKRAGRWQPDSTPQPQDEELRERVLAALDAEPKCVHCTHVETSHRRGSCCWCCSQGYFLPPISEDVVSR